MAARRASSRPRARVMASPASTTWLSRSLAASQFVGRSSAQSGSDVSRTHARASSSESTSSVRSLVVLRTEGGLPSGVSATHSALPVALASRSCTSSPPISAIHLVASASPVAGLGAFAGVNMATTREIVTGGRGCRCGCWLGGGGGWSGCSGGWRCSPWLTPRASWAAIPLRMRGCCCCTPAPPSWISGRIARTTAAASSAASSCELCEVGGTSCALPIPELSVSSMVWMSCTSRKRADPMFSTLDERQCVAKSAMSDRSANPARREAIKPVEREGCTSREMPMVSSALE